MKQKVEKGGYIQNDEMHIKVKEEQTQMSIYDFALKGKHNQYNTMAASVAGATMDIRKEKIREAVETFENLESALHRAARRAVTTKQRENTISQEFIHGTAMVQDLFRHHSQKGAK